MRTYSDMEEVNPSFHAHERTHHFRHTRSLIKQLVLTRDRIGTDLTIYIYWCHECQKVMDLGVDD